MVLCLTPIRTTTPRKGKGYTSLLPIALLVSKSKIGYFMCGVIKG